MPYKDAEKQRANIRRLQTEKRRKLYNLKEGTPCADCGNYYPHYVMEYDHLGDKLFEVSLRSASFGSALVFEELAKCELVCANCHRVRTYNRAAVAKVVTAGA